ncbi:MAG: F0F1 ATP synthase subunit alpha [Bacteroides sp.]|nr:MAG: F0F1 ATP synthase subunit alpha [Bacteroides sp.]
MTHHIKPDEISDIIKNRLSDNLNNTIKEEEIGTVLQVGDGIARVYGLDNIKSGEIVLFNYGLKGVAFNLEEDNVGVILLGNCDNIREGDIVKRGYKMASIPVGEGLLGRVIDTLGNPIDNKGPIKGFLIDLPIERNAPGIIYRQPINEPLQTGIKSIDSMIPIGKGQRELIIGDRKTGKTTIAIDTIINQRQFFETDNPTYCIYVACGQKQSSIAQTVKILEDHDAMKYTIVVVASASDASPMQFYAPFSGTTIGEYFRDIGKNAIIVYDDLSKQANAYREVSLLLKRPPSREAYPGDVFYLHARLLERSAKLNSDINIIKDMNDVPENLSKMVKGGGSLTALPIIETQLGDVSAYIPTNVISITDGQIFLDTTLFNLGIKPAVNVNISVSRVGSNAQIKSMKQVSSTLKLDQAQYKELESFSKFSSDIDIITKNILDKGARNIEILKQDKHCPMPVEYQVAVIYCGVHGLLNDIKVSLVKMFEEDLIKILRQDYVLINHIVNHKMDVDSQNKIKNIVVSILKNNKYFNK